MSILDIVIKNIIRRKSKAIFILAGIVIGISTVVAIITYSEAMTDDINSKMEKYGANILLMPETENLSLNYGGMSIGGVSFEVKEINENDLLKISTIKNSKNIAAVGPVILGIVEIKNKKVLLAGVNFLATRVFKPWWEMRGSLPDINELVAGSETARILNIKKGDAITIRGRKLKVSSIISETGSQDDQILFADIKVVQTILGKKGKISMAEVAALCSACPVGEMVEQISSVLPGVKVMAIQQVVKNRMKMFSHLKKFAIGVSGVVLIIGSLMVMVTMMSSIRERTKEIGIFRAIGFRKIKIAQIVLLEAALLSSIAGILGYFIGFGGARIIIDYMTKNSEILILVNPILLGSVFILSLIIGTVSSIYPAIIASRLNPGEALRAL